VIILDLTSLFNQFAKYRGIHDNILTRIVALSGSISITEKWRVGCFEVLIICRLSRKLGFFQLIRGAPAIRILPPPLEALIKINDKISIRDFFERNEARFFVSLIFFIVPPFL
jgi:hypothetical protein